MEKIYGDSLVFEQFNPVMPGHLLDKCRLTFDTFNNDFRVRHTLTKYLKESCRWSFGEHLSFNYFLKIPFIRAIKPKESGRYWLANCNRK